MPSILLDFDEILYNEQRKMMSFIRSFIIVHRLSEHSYIRFHFDSLNEFFSQELSSYINK